MPTQGQERVTFVYLIGLAAAAVLVDLADLFAAALLLFVLFLVHFFILALLALANFALLALALVQRLLGGFFGLALVLVTFLAFLAADGFVLVLTALL